jgi:hypothetical protein
MGRIKGDKYGIHVLFRERIQSAHWPMGRIKGDKYALHVPICERIQSAHWPMGRIKGDKYAIHVPICACVCAKPRKLAGDDVYSCDES